MKKSYFIIFIMIFIIILTACKGVDFNGSRTGNTSELIMKYSMFDTTDSQLLELEKDDVIDVEIKSDSGKLNVLIQKDSSEPIYESKNVPTSSFQVKINESGTYKVTVTGEKAQGSVSFIKNVE
ncbi:hypothetical protein HGQ85_07800 [Clostridioides difficile]|nr:hypothetical protein [Clostridioides difficile]